MYEFITHYDVRDFFIKARLAGAFEDTFQATVLNDSVIIETTKKTIKKL